MNRTPRTARTALALGAACVVLAPLLAGCGAGSDAIAGQDYPGGYGLLRTVGDLRVLDALLVVPEGGGQRAVLSMAVANDGTEDDRLLEVAVRERPENVDPEAAPEQAFVEGGQGVELPAAQLVRFGTEETGAEPLIVTDLDIAPGSSLDVALRFERAGTVSFAPPVLIAEGPLEDYLAPSERPTPTASASETSAPTTSPTGAPTASPEATADANPSP